MATEAAALLQDTLAGRRNFRKSIARLNLDPAGFTSMCYRLRMGETEAYRTARSLIADFGIGALPLVEQAANKLRTLGMAESLKFWIEVAAAIRAIQAGSGSERV